MNEPDMTVVLFGALAVTGAFRAAKTSAGILAQLGISFRSLSG